MTSPTGRIIPMPDLQRLLVHTDDDALATLLATEPPSVSEVLDLSHVEARVIAHMDRAPIPTFGSIFGSILDDALYDMREIYRPIRIGGTTHTQKPRTKKRTAAQSKRLSKQQAAKKARKKNR